MTGVDDLLRRAYARVTDMDLWTRDELGDLRFILAAERTAQSSS
jgi:hypothetical protein